MVTQIRKHAKPRLYLREHREARDISAEQMAGRLNIARESVLRLEREQHRLNPDKIAAYAHALGDDVQPSDLWHYPRKDAPQSIDAIIRNAPDDIQNMARDIVRRLVSGGN